MHVNVVKAGRPDIPLDTLAAELTAAAYPVALRHGAGEQWLDLELDLWRALTDTIRKWGPELSRSGVQPDAVLADGRARPAPRRNAHLTLSK